MAVNYIGDNGPDGMCLGTATTEKIGFYGKTPAVQSTSTFATSDVGTASSADVTTGQKAALIAIMNTLSAAGLWPAQA